MAMTVARPHLSLARRVDSLARDIARVVTDADDDAPARPRDASFARASVASTFDGPTPTPTSPDSPRVPTSRARLVGRSSDVDNPHTTTPARDARASRARVPSARREATEFTRRVFRPQRASRERSRGRARATARTPGMPLVGARESRARSAFTATAFQPVGQTSSASTSTGMTTGSNGGGRSRRSNAGVKASATQVAATKATKATGARGGRSASAASGAKEESYVGFAMRGMSHVPHGNTALSVKADEERLSTITDEKERKRLKRLLRNRVSAQQARERKKAYLASLEHTEAQKARDLHELENRVATLERENQMLRQVIQTVTRKAVPPNAADFNHM